MILRAGLLGFPLGHSVSPAMHNAAASALQIPLHYELWQVDPEGLPAAVSTLRGESWLGANVTLPHKPAMLPLVDESTALVQRIGALNTVYKRDGRLIGENTDAPALLRCLTHTLHLEPEQERVLVLGAGGAARAAVVTLADAGVASLGLWNRTYERAARLVAELVSADVVSSSRVQAVDPSRIAAWARWATLLVNATSVGLDGESVPWPALYLPAGARVFDMVYGLDGTPLVRQARARGFPAEDGLWMLVYQAARSFALWTGQEPPESVMHDAAVEALRARAPGDGAMT